VSVVFGKIPFIFWLLVSLFLLPDRPRIDQVMCPDAAVCAIFCSLLYYCLKFHCILVSTQSD